MSKSAQEALPNVREWSGVPSRMSRSVLEALSDCPEGSVGPPVCPGVVRRPFLMSGSVREAIPVVREFSGDPPGCP